MWGLRLKSQLNLTSPIVVIKRKILLIHSLTLSVCTVGGSFLWHNRPADDNKPAADDAELSTGIWTHHQRSQSRCVICCIAFCHQQWCKQDFFETKTKILFLFIFEQPQDQDFGLEDCHTLLCTSIVVSLCKSSTCYSAFTRVMTHEQKCFTVSDVASDWHERAILHCYSEWLNLFMKWTI